MDINILWGTLGVTRATALTGGLPRNVKLHLIRRQAIAIVVVVVVRVPVTVDIAHITRIVVVARPKGYRL